MRHRERSQCVDHRRRGRRGFAAALIGLGVVAGMAALLSSHPAGEARAGGPPAALHVGVGQTASTPCASSADCNDHNGCTDDTCVNNVCVFTPRPGCVACAPQYDCPPMEIFFVVDTSGSMKDEAQALCNSIDAVFDDLAAQGLLAFPTILGITDTGSAAFSCLEGTVTGTFGSNVPGTPGSCVFPGGTSPYESWGPATALVAGRHFWAEDLLHMVVPLGDEGPCNGSRPNGCNDPGDDRDSINNAINVAAGRNIVVSPIIGTGATECVRTLADDLAAGTGGMAVHLEDAASELPAALYAIIRQHCDRDDSCTDGTACTVGDTCIEGACIGTPIYDAETECCRPQNGATTLIDDDNPCTEDVCNPLTGVVTHTPIDVGGACDDGNDCSYDDVCDETGICQGEDVTAIPCSVDGECPSFDCDQQTGFCACGDTPRLCVVPDLGNLSEDGCYNVGEEFTVRVRLGFSTETVSAGDLLLGYDPVVLKFLDVVPGDVVDPASPFAVELQKNVNEATGRIFYSVGAGAGSPGSQGPTTMAAVRFRALRACDEDELCLLSENPQHTRLTGIGGVEIPHSACCSGPILTNGAPPVLSCPQSVKLNADPGRVTADVTWSPVTATSQCDGTAPVICTATNSFGANINHLIAAGGRHPSGQNSYECVASDSCGGQSVCAWTVSVNQSNNVLLDLELSPRMSADVAYQPLLRCIELAFFSNCVQEPVVVQETVAFGLPFNLPGRALDVPVKIPAGEYQCVTARDPKHTLRSVSNLSIEGRSYRARFRGDPFFGGNWLVNGNLDGSGVIDILDFGAFVNLYLSVEDPDTPCGHVGLHADFNGDGRVDVLDWSFISINFLATDKQSCCPNATATSEPENQPVMSITVAELEARGLSHLRFADLNGDGILDAADVAEFLATQAVMPERMVEPRDAVKPVRTRGE